MTTDHRDPLLAPLRSLLNRQIERSTPARLQVHELENRTMAIRLRNTGLTLYFSVANGQLDLFRHYESDPDVILDTTVIGLAELARGTASSGRVDVAGDPVIAQRFQQLLQHTHPDWEEELSRVVGDVAAHQVGNFFRGAMSFGQRAFDSVTRSSAEFIQEERREVPSPSEMNELSERVSSLSQNVEAITRRVEKLLTRKP